MYREETKGNVPKHNSSYLWIMGLWIFLYFFCMSKFSTIICNFYNQRGKSNFFFKIMSNTIHLNQSQPHAALKAQMPTCRKALGKQPSSHPCINISTYPYNTAFTTLNCIHYLLISPHWTWSFLKEGTLSCVYILYNWHIK